MAKVAKRETYDTPDAWDQLVQIVVRQPTLEEPRDGAKRDALELAAAALRYAGQRDLAKSLAEQARA